VQMNKFEWSYKIGDGDYFIDSRGGI
jgi:hypothetical protein